MIDGLLIQVHILQTVYLYNHLHTNANPQTPPPKLKSSMIREPTPESARSPRRPDSLNPPKTLISTRHLHQTCTAPPITTQLDYSLDHPVRGQEQVQQGTTSMRPVIPGRLIEAPRIIMRIMQDGNQGIPGLDPGPNSPTAPAPRRTHHHRIVHRSPWAS